MTKSPQSSKIQTIHVDFKQSWRVKVKGQWTLHVWSTNNHQTAHYVCKRVLVSCKTFWFSNMRFNVCKIELCVVGIRENPESTSDLLGSSPMRLALRWHQDDFIIEFSNQLLNSITSHNFMLKRWYPSMILRFPTSKYFWFSSSHFRIYPTMAPAST